MEALAVVASVIAVIQISDRVIHLVKYYLETGANVPSDLRRILVEISMLNTILKSLEYLQQCHHITPALWDQLTASDGPIQACHHTITELEKLFPLEHVVLQPQHDSSSGSKKGRVKAAMATLAWPLKAKKAEALLQKISQYRNVLNLALMTESVQDIKSIKKRTEDIHVLATESQRNEMYRWLEMSNPSSIHNRVWKDYEPGTGVWMLRSDAWKNWLMGTNRCLWIYGIPGAGKTILASFLIEQIEEHCKQTTEKLSGQAYYYCYFGHNRDEASPFLRWIICQLCRQAKSIPVQLHELFEAGKDPSHVALLSVLETILDKFDSAYIAIDALDESSPRSDLLEIVRDLASDPRFSKLRILATSRDYLDIRRTMDGISTAVSMFNPLVEADIRVHIHSLLSQNRKFRLWPRDILEEVENTVSRGAKGMFRWAVCQLDVLQRLRCDRAVIQSALKTLPKTLDETYERIFNTILKEEWPAVRHVLQWMWFHSQLYSTVTDAMSYTIVYQLVQHTLEKEKKFAVETNYDSEHILELCGCLIRVGDDNSINFAHYTVLEYLKSERIETGCASFFALHQAQIVSNYTQVAILHSQSNLAHLVVPADLRSKRPNEIWKDPQKAWRWLTIDVSFYLAISALYSIATLFDEFAPQNSIIPSIIDFLNPRSDHYSQLSCLAQDVLYAGHSTYFTVPEQCWKRMPESREAAALLQLILMTNDSGNVVLAKDIIEESDIRDLMSSKLAFGPIKLLNVGNDPTQAFGHFHFDGTVLEIICQLASSSLCVKSLLDLLLKKYEGGSDTSKLLLSYVGSHWRHCEAIGCTKSCPLIRLLGNGANSNFDDYRVTPLQIAVACWDYNAVEHLLKAGAEPNFTGNYKGEYWASEHILGRFNHLCGLSPLYICKQLDCVLKFRNYRDFERPTEGRRKMIEELLLQHGAVSIQFRNCTARLHGLM